MRKQKEEIGKIFGHILVHDDDPLLKREITDAYVVEPLMRVVDKSFQPDAPEKFEIPARQYADDLEDSIQPLMRVTSAGIKDQDPGIKEQEENEDDTHFVAPLMLVRPKNDSHGK